MHEPMTDQELHEAIIRMQQAIRLILTLDEQRDERGEDTVRLAPMTRRQLMRAVGMSK